MYYSVALMLFVSNMINVIKKCDLLITEYLRCKCVILVLTFRKFAAF